MHPYRTHHCGQLRREHAGAVVRLSGFVHRTRNHGNVLFVDLRDHHGRAQLVVSPEASCHARAAALSRESVVTATGCVVERAREQINTSLPTGEVEVRIESLEVLSDASALPFPVDDEHPAGESERLTWRFLDLRRAALHERVQLRSEMVASIRRRLEASGFSEYTTPLLTSSSPEGARDFLVPSRLHPGHFFALPQAPQQFKQLLMAAGFDRYYQIAPCFRDEDARADRFPGEFHQLDLEMAYATQEDVFEVVEELLAGLSREFAPWRAVPTPFPSISHAEALQTYGSDKPDLRVPLRLVDLTDLFGAAGFRLLGSIVDSGGVVRGLPVPDVGDAPRSLFTQLEGFARERGADGLAWVLRDAHGFRGPVAEALGDSLLAELSQRAAAGLPGAAGELPVGAALLFVAGEAAPSVALAGALRLEVARRLGLFEEDVFRFCWVTDFPFYEADPETGAVGFSHNPFSMPHGGLEALRDEPPLAVRAQQYDIVCNGLELSSGAVRNHRADIMLAAFAIAGYPSAQVEERFGALLHAFRCGCPPHAGIAPGIDRLAMLLAGAANLREVTAFPKDAQGRDLLMNAPAPVSEGQLGDLGIRLR